MSNDDDLKEFNSDSSDDEEEEEWMAFQIQSDLIDTGKIQNKKSQSEIGFKDPLGIYNEDEMKEKIEHKEANLKYNMKSNKFKPEVFLETFHATTSWEDLEKGLENLVKIGNDEQSANQKDLFESYFEDTVLLKMTLQEAFEKYKLKLIEEDCAYELKNVSIESILAGVTPGTPAAEETQKNPQLAQEESFFSNLRGITGGIGSFKPLRGVQSPLFSNSLFKKESTTTNEDPKVNEENQKKLRRLKETVISESLVRKYEHLETFDPLVKTMKAKNDKVQYEIQQHYSDLLDEDEYCMNLSKIIALLESERLDAIISICENIEQARFQGDYDKVIFYYKELEALEKFMKDDELFEPIYEKAQEEVRVFQGTLEKLITNIKLPLKERIHYVELLIKMENMESAALLFNTEISWSAMASLSDHVAVFSQKYKQMNDMEVSEKKLKELTEHALSTHASIMKDQCRRLFKLYNRLYANLDVRQSNVANDIVDEEEEMMKTPVKAIIEGPVEEDRLSVDILVNDTDQLSLSKKANCFVRFQWTDKKANSFEERPIACDVLVETSVKEKTNAPQWNEKCRVFLPPHPPSDLLLWAVLYNKVNDTKTEVVGCANVKFDEVIPQPAIHHLSHHKQNAGELYLGILSTLESSTPQKEEPLMIEKFEDEDHELVSEILDVNQQVPRVSFSIPDESKQHVLSFVNSASSRFHELLLMFDTQSKSLFEHLDNGSWDQPSYMKGYSRLFNMLTKLLALTTIPDTLKQALSVYRESLYNRVIQRFKDRALSHIDNLKEDWILLPNGTSDTPLSFERGVQHIMMFLSKYSALHNASNDHHELLFLGKCLEKLRLSFVKYIQHEHLRDALTTHYGVPSVSSMSSLKLSDYHVIDRSILITLFNSFYSLHTLLPHLFNQFLEQYSSSEHELFVLKKKECEKFQVLVKTLQIDLFHQYYAKSFSTLSQSMELPSKYHQLTESRLYMLRYFTEFIHLHAKSYLVSDTLGDDLIAGLLYLFYFMLFEKNIGVRLTELECDHVGQFYVEFFVFFNVFARPYLEMNIKMPSFEAIMDPLKHPDMLSSSMYTPPLSQKVNAALNSLKLQFQSLFAEKCSLDPSFALSIYDSLLSSVHDIENHTPYFYDEDAQDDPFDVSHLESFVYITPSLLTTHKERLLKNPKELALLQLQYYIDMSNLRFSSQCQCLRVYRPHPHSESSSTVNLTDFAMHSTMYGNTIVDLYKELKTNTVNQDD